MNSLPPISLNTALLLIFAACACYALIRGAWRTLIGTVVLALAAWAAHAAWRAAPSYSLSPLVTNGAPVVVFLATSFLLRRFLSFLFQSNGSFLSFGIFGKLLISLLPTALLCLIAAAIILHRGSVAELRHPETSSSSLSRWKQTIDRLLPTSLSSFLDPSSSPRRISLARLIATRATSAPPPEIDPATGKPIPRAIIVDDPELQGLARSGDFSTLLRHPLLEKALNDPRLLKLLPSTDH